MTTLDTIAMCERPSCAYCAIKRFFDWCQEHELTLQRIEAAHVAAYIEQYADRGPTVKQHLAAIRMLFDFLVKRELLLMNPAASVRAPRPVVTPCSEREQLGEALHQAMAELHVLLEQQIQNKAATQQQHAELTGQLAQAREHQHETSAAYRGHVDTHHCQ